MVGTLADPQTWAFPEICGTHAKGKKTYWRIFVRVINGTGEPINIAPEWLDGAKMPSDLRGWFKVNSHVGDDGKVRESAPTIITAGKNIGKVNETNVLTQAIRDANSLHEKQLKKVATAPISGIVRYPPMLASVIDKDFNEYKNTFIQRKYNGVRCVSTVDEKGDVIMYSRRGLTFPGFDEIKEELGFILHEGLYLDSEIYRHGARLQELSGLARGEVKAGEAKLYIYDLFIPDKPDLLFSERFALLSEMLEGEFTYLVLVETFAINSREESDTLYKRFLAENYEGSILRLNAPYKYSYNDYHSRVLLKIKPTYDAEFKIIGYELGERGKLKGAVIFVCETPAGNKFNVSLSMTVESRKNLAVKLATRESNDKTHFENAYLGKKLIVEFDEYSADGVPLRARTSGVIRTWD